MSDHTKSRKSLFGTNESRSNPGKYEISKRYISGKLCSTRSVNYDNWEYAYFPYLVDMYNIAFNDPVLEPYPMRKFFEFIYQNSSGHISTFLKEMNVDEEQAYQEYKNKL